MQDYFLPAHVHFCRRGADFVFLDLKKDTYTLVNGTGATALRNLLSPPATTSEFEPEIIAALSNLASEGLLTTNPDDRVVEPMTLDIALEPLLDDPGPDRMRITPGVVAIFVAACVAAAARLRFCHIETTIRAVKTRKTKCDSRTPNWDRMRELTCAFIRLRSLFPRDYVCIYDSLALIEFLARYRIYPLWVFGVRLEPWAAHCWVQHEGRIFNEGVEEAAGYTPVMAV